MGQFEGPSAWSLTDLFPAGKALDDALTQLEQAVSEFEALREVLTPAISLPDFKTALAKLEAIAKLSSRIEGYAELSFSADTQSPAALNLRDRINQVLTDLGNRCLFFDLWFKDLPDDAAENLMAASGDLRYFLQTYRRFKPFTLTEAEEKVISSKDVNGIDALIHLYEMITNAFTFTLEIDGEKRSLSRDELKGYFLNPSADVRARAYQELYRVYQENATVLAQIYIYRARDWHTEGIELRGYPSPIAARNLDNDLPDTVVDTLLAVCRQNAGLFQRYFKLKRQWLGLNQLRRYDIYAPLAP